MDLIMPNYAGLFGLSGNVNDQRNPYGNLASPSLSGAQANITQAPTYQPIDQFAPNMLPSQKSSNNIGQNQSNVMPLNQRPLPQWFQPPPQPPPIQNMNFQGGYSPSPSIPINLLPAF